MCYLSSIQITTQNCKNKKYFSYNLLTNIARKNLSFLYFQQFTLRSLIMESFSSNFRKTVKAVSDLEKPEGVIFL